MSDVCEEYNGSSFDQCIYSWIDTELIKLFKCAIHECQLENPYTAGQIHIVDKLIGEFI
jgi:hypothetical protein